MTGFLGSEIPGSPLNSCVEADVVIYGRLCVGRWEDGPRVAALGDDGALNELLRVTPILRATDF